jgi:hypothetical protein
MVRRQLQKNRISIRSEGLPGRLKRLGNLGEPLMKSAYRSSVTVLALFWCIHVCAAPYPTEDQLRVAIQEVAGMLKTEGLELEVLDAKKEGMALPLMAAGLSLQSGVCIAFYNAEPEDGLIQFFAAVDKKELPVVLNALAVHEASHCVEQREAYVRKHFDKVLPPDFKRDHVTVQGYLSAVKSGALETWGEALADIASVLYLKRAAPGRWAHLASSIAAMRHDLAWKWPEHDTSVWLHKIISADIGEVADQSLFETAFELRARYRPDE